MHLKDFDCTDLFRSVHKFLSKHFLSLLLEGRVVPILLGEDLRPLPPAERYFFLEIPPNVLSRCLPNRS